MSFYEPDGNGFRATLSTRGPWDPRFQHGGPPCALLVGAAERFGAEAASSASPGFQVARFAAEFARPIPVDGRLTIEVVPDRLGRQVQRLDLRLTCDGDRVLSVRVLRIRIEPQEHPIPAPPDWPEPETLDDFDFPFFAYQPAYHTAVQLRIAEGSWGTTPVGFWARARMPLVAGRDLSPLEQLVLLADAQSGMGVPLPPRDWTFVNPDLTVLLHRAPQPGWVGFAIDSIAGPAGAGLAESRLCDRTGLVGRSAQTLVVVKRPAAGGATPSGR